MFEFVTQSVLFLVSLVFLLGVVVIIHELGHYFAGKFFGAAVESYSVGFGSPVVTRMDASGTFWQLRWIPLGGFVKFAQDYTGTLNEDYVPPKGKLFDELTVGQRAIVAVAGPFANFLLAIVLFAGSVLVNGEPQTQVIIDSVVEESPAQSAGFRVGDVIHKVDGKIVENPGDFLPAIQLGVDRELEVSVLRDMREINLFVTPERQLRDNGLGQKLRIGTIGVGFEFVRMEPKSYGLFGSIGLGVERTLDTIALTGRVLGRLVTGKESLDMLSGPIGIGDTTRRVVNSVVEIESIPWSARIKAIVLILVEICALISVGIGLFNLLPFPVLDGGHLLFLAYEAATGKALPQKIQELSLTLGLVILLSLVVVITWGDIVKIGLFG